MKPQIIENLASAVAIIATIVSVFGFARDARKDLKPILVQSLLAFKRLFIVLLVDCLFVLFWIGMNWLLDVAIKKLPAQERLPSVPFAFLTVTRVVTFLVVAVFIISDRISVFRVFWSKISEMRSD